MARPEGTVPLTRVVEALNALPDAVRAVSQAGGVHGLPHLEVAE